MGLFLMRVSLRAQAMSKILVAPLEALTDPELTDQERRVLLALFSYRGRLTENVWPTREQIGERANIKDLVAVGKRTSALAKKGWLKKWKVGYSGHMTYTMLFPVRLETPVDTIGEPLEVESTSNALEVKSTSHTRHNPPPHTRHNPPTALNKPINKPKQERGPFKKPSIKQLIDFKNEHNFISDPQDFMNYHDSRGWTVGKGPMVDWMGAFRRWETNEKKWSKANGRTGSSKATQNYLDINAQF